MRKYLELLANEIYKVIINSENPILIKLEGFENPIIYKELVDNFFKEPRFKKFNIYAKLSYEKYMEFKANKEFDYYTEYLMSGGYVLDNESMTKIRNSISNYVYKNDKNVYILMGTELIQDKGGLADFYTINPDYIYTILNGDYGKLFTDLSIENIEENKDKISLIYNVIFKYRNVDIQKLSEFVDEISKKNIRTIDDLIEEIFFSLNVYWDTPKIIDERGIPKSKDIKNANSSCLKILDKAIKFIDRKDFKDILTEKKENSYINKIDNYSDENGIDKNMPFPRDSNIYNSYNEFKDSLINFIKGKEIDLNKEKLLEVDFYIIDKILGLNNKSKTKYDTQIKIYGSPLEVYQKMILLSLNKYYIEREEFYNEVIITVDEIKLSNTSTEEELRDFYQDLSMNLAGIVDFINSYDIVNNDGEKINIQYKNNIDVFALDFENNNIRHTNNLDDLCKISFFIEINDLKYKYLWTFSPFEGWLKNFIFLKKYRDTDSLPLMLKCKKINKYVNCSSDREFFMKLEKIEVESLNDSINSIIIKYDNELKFYYQSMNNYLLKMSSTINDLGWYSCFNDDILKSYINSYKNLMEYIYKNFDIFQSNQKQSLHYFINLFLITKDEKNGINSLEVDEAIVLPYHPAVLEKFIYQIDFMIKVYINTFEEVKRRKVTSDNSIEKRLNKFFELCKIVDGVEILANNYEQFITTKTVYGLYCIYKGKDRYSFDLDCEIKSEVVVDNDEETIELISKSATSQIVSDAIVEYLTTFPAKSDNLKIVVVKPNDIQSIVSGLHTVIQRYKKEEINLNIELNVIISDLNINLIEYMKYWLDNYFSEDEIINIKTYINILDFNSKNLIDKLGELFDNVDLTIIFNIVDENKIVFKEDYGKKLSNGYKYPILFIPEPITRTNLSCSVTISQSQFEVAHLHTQLVYLLKQDNIKRNKLYRAVKEYEIKETTLQLIEYAHQKSIWVLCIDQVMNKEILLENNNKKIISFTTGEGNYGELNTTISSNERIIDDINKKLIKRLNKIFTNWSSDRKEIASRHCINIAQNIEESRLLKALNPHDYQVYNFLAYVLTLQQINNIKSDTLAIRTIVSLDSYRHWFNSAKANNKNELLKRPDLLLLEVYMDERNMNKENPLYINATAIECKMSSLLEGIDFEKASQQIVDGIKVLSKNFATNTNSIDSRYWYGQLYRLLVFSKLNIEENSDEYNVLVEKLQNILNGDYIIDWDGYIYAYNLKNNIQEVQKTELNVCDELKEIGLNSIKIYNYGQLDIQKMLLPEEKREEEFVFDENIEDFGTSIDEEIDITEESEYENEEKENKNDKKMVEEYKQIDSANVDKNNEDTKEFRSIEHNSNMQIKTTEIDIKKPINEIRILLGRDVRTNEKIYWEYGNKQLNNRHLLISGNSGSGKTYCIQMLLYELSKYGVSSIIFDYTDGFTKQKLDPKLIEIMGDKIKEKIVYLEKFPLNPFKRMEQYIGNHKILEKYSDAAIRVSSIFKAIYNFGDQQNGSLYNAILNCYQKYADNITLEKVIEELTQESSNFSRTIINKIRPFVDSEPFDYKNNFSWEEIINSNGQIYIIQLTGFNRETQLLITEFILWDIWNYAVKTGDESRPIPIILDEAQNLDHSANSPTAKILTEGRKFGLSGWFATQFLKKQLKEDEIQRLQQAGQKLYFSPPEAEIFDVAQYVSNRKEQVDSWLEKIKTLKKGECITSGYGLNKANIFSRYEPKIIKITSLEERIDGNE